MQAVKAGIPKRAVDHIVIGIDRETSLYFLYRQAQAVRD
jgi:hypothetical protein